jgi:hypothetical protein
MFRGVPNRSAVWLAVLLALFLPGVAVGDEEPPPQPANPCDIQVGGDGLVGDFLSATLGNVAEAIRDFFCWLVDFAWVMGRPLLETFSGFLSDGWKAHIAMLWAVAGLANKFVPLDFAFSLLAAYWAFLLVFVTIKYILKLIPTIG